MAWSFNLVSDSLACAASRTVCNRKHFPIPKTILKFRNERKICNDVKRWGRLSVWRLFDQRLKKLNNISGHRFDSDFVLIDKSKQTICAIEQVCLQLESVSKKVKTWFSINRFATARVDQLFVSSRCNSFAVSRSLDSLPSFLTGRHYFVDESRINFFLPQGRTKFPHRKQNDSDKSQRSTDWHRAE